MDVEQNRGGFGVDGIGYLASPGGVRYRASYGAYNDLDLKTCQRRLRRE